MAELVVVHRRHFVAPEAHAAGGDAGGLVEELGNGEQEGGLPATGLAHDGEELAPVEFEVDVVDGDDGTGVRGISH